MSEAIYTFGFGWRVPAEPARPTARPVQFAMRRIADEVAERHGLTIYDLTGLSRVKHICAARFEAICWIYRERRSNGNRVYSLSQIGAFFNRDHTTVLNAIRRYEEQSGYCGGVAA